MRQFALNELCAGVRPVHGEEMVYNVTSQSRNGLEWRVELDAFGGNGQCGCESFVEGAKQKKLEAGAMPSAALECRHIARAKRHYTYMKLREDMDRRNGLAEANKRRHGGK